MIFTSFNNNKYNNKHNNKHNKHNKQKTNSNIIFEEQTEYLRENYIDKTFDYFHNNNNNNIDLVSYSLNFNYDNKHLISVHLMSNHHIISHNDNILLFYLPFFVINYKKVLKIFGL